MAYYYTTLPGIIPAPFPGDAKTAGPPVIFSKRVLMEHVLKDFRITAERADLEDRRRIFRVEDRYIDRMQKDGTGYFLAFNNQKFYFVPTDPITPADTFIREWGPL